MTRHIGQFSTLRFGAAFWVFLSHVLLIIEKPIPFISEGDLAVDLFIILSGFVITLMLLKRPEPYGGYIFRRFVRLYPLYLVALGLGILTQAYYEPVIGQSLFGAPAVENFGQRVSAVDNNLWQHLGLHLTMMHGAIPDTLLPLASLAFSGPLWSISLEWQFYLIAPFLIWALDLRVPGRWRVAVPVFAAMILSCYLARRYWHADVPSFLPLRLPLFGLGILCGVAWQRVGTTHPAIIIGGSMGSALLLSTIGFRLLPLAMWFAVYIVAGLSDRVRGTGRRQPAVESQTPHMVGGALIRPLCPAHAHSPLPHLFSHPPCRIPAQSSYLCPGVTGHISCHYRDRSHPLSLHRKASGSLGQKEGIRSCEPRCTQGDSLTAGLHP